MKNTLIAILFALLPGIAVASGDDIHLDKANIDPTNKESLQRGAKTFVNYCMSCHSAKYQRYNRLARDLEISEDDVRLVKWNRDATGGKQSVVFKEGSLSQFVKEIST